MGGVRPDLRPDLVSACLVTRGNVDLTPILETLPYGEVIVYDNSKREDLGIYGRYAAIEEASNPYIYTQDDDVIVTCHEALLAAYRPGVLTVNYPEPLDIPWPAAGSIFDRDLPARAFARYEREYPLDRDFTHFMCDGVFALLTETQVIDEGYEDLEYGYGNDRVSNSPDWYWRQRPLIKTRCAVLA